MRNMMWRTAAAVCLTLALASQARPGELELPRDGWASWQMDAVEGAPSWCCGNKDRDASRMSCKLDVDSGNFSSHHKETTDTVRVYARMAGGKVDRLRVLSPSCAVETETPVREIQATTEDSASWLSAMMKGAASSSGKDLRDEATTALAMHRGTFVHNELVTSARTDGPLEIRKKAVFWLAMLRGTAGAEVATDLMFNDKHAELRKHASFAVSQSKSPNITADLIRLGNTDKEGDVRAQAWFWLAITGAENVEAPIVQALRKDADAHVREQAVFALSRLPEDRATRALIAAAEDVSLTREQRKRALFWLAQSESKAAQIYLDKVLARTG